MRAGPACSSGGVASSGAPVHPSILNMGAAGRLVLLRSPRLVPTARLGRSSVITLSMTAKTAGGVRNRRTARGKLLSAGSREPWARRRPARGEMSA